MLHRLVLTTARMSSEYKNRLGLEKSPYLLQHANNPIDWYPWGQEAFQKAKEKNLPIFLSVGYSTCHWCHVMERESFENVETAKILNENFVAIKVDREERPDVDKLYMAFVVAASGHGGWPMSVFLTPELYPITGGTYFPPDDSRGMLGFPTILNMIHTEWKKEGKNLSERGAQIIKLLQPEMASGDVNSADEVFNAIFTHKQKTFDTRLGGFGRAPKFPKPSDLDFLIAFAASSVGTDAQRSEALEMVQKTLESMADGGIHDHVGNGFHRYSVDAEWHVPHFEKMLYDQSQLLATYSDFYRLKRDEHLKYIIADIFEYMEKISHKEGGFYAAEDADSLPRHEDREKVEGAFCVWEKEEVERLLGDRVVGSSRLFDIFCEYFDVEDGGNVASDPHGEFQNKNVLRKLLTDEECAANHGITVDELKDGVEEAKLILWQFRKSRPAPHLDSKMVTAWQGLAITGLVKAHQATGEKKYLKRAEKCAAFVGKYLEEQGELRRAVYLGADGEVEQSSEQRAFSDDYAFLVQGLLDLYTVTGKDGYLRKAEQLQKTCDEKFWSENGGYFISERVEGEVAVRMIEDQDGAEPTATSIAANNLLRLYDILEKEEYRERAKKCFRGASEKLNSAPLALPKMAIALERWQTGSTTVVLVGDQKSELISDALSRLATKFIANLSVVHIGSDDDFLASHGEMAKGARPAIYFCQGFVCDRPVRSLEELDEKWKTL